MIDLADESKNRAVVNTTIHQSYFPNSSAVLWNRSVIRFPRFLKAADAVPSIFLPSSDVKIVLAKIEEISEESIYPTIQFFLQTKFFIDIVQHRLRSEYGEPRYVFVFAQDDFSIDDKNTGSNNSNNSSSNSDNSKIIGGSDPKNKSKLNVPVQLQTTSFSDPEGFNVHNDSSESVMKELAHSIRFDKSFEMASMMKIRARGCVKRVNTNIYSELLTTSPSLNPPEIETSFLHGKLRFEAIIPNISFEVSRINSIPILATPLSRKLAEGSENYKKSVIFSRPKMGYVTLNQTRKIVPILDNDPSVGIIPVVGVWVALHLDQKDDDNYDDYITHPYCWGACVRFLASSEVKERVFVEQHTFLLMLIIGKVTQYYEVKRTGSGAQNDAFFDSADDFVRSYFDIELSAPQSGDSGNFYDGNGIVGDKFTKPILCKFRPMTDEKNIESFGDSVNFSNAPRINVINRNISIEVYKEYNSAVSADNDRRKTNTIKNNKSKNSYVRNYTNYKSLYEEEEEERDKEDTKTVTSIISAPPVPRAFVPTPISSPVRNIPTSAQTSPPLSPFDNAPVTKISQFTSESAYTSTITPVASESIALHKITKKSSETSVPMNANSESYELKLSSLPIRNQNDIIDNHTSKLRRLPLPAEIISAQQVQLDMLSKQIAELRDLVMALGAQKIIQTDMNDTIQIRSSNNFYNSDVNQLSAVEVKENDTSISIPLEQKLHSKSTSASVSTRTSRNSIHLPLPTSEQSEYMNDDYKCKNSILRNSSYNHVSLVPSEEFQSGNYKHDQNQDFAHAIDEDSISDMELERILSSYISNLTKNKDVAIGLGYEIYNHENKVNLKQTITPTQSIDFNRQKESSPILDSVYLSGSLQSSFTTNTCTDNLIPQSKLSNRKNSSKSKVKVIDAVAKKTTPFSPLNHQRRRKQQQQPQHSYDIDDSSVLDTDSIILIQSRYLS